MFNPQKSLWPESKQKFSKWPFSTKKCQFWCQKWSFFSKMDPNRVDFDWNWLNFNLKFSASTSTLKLPLSPRPNLMPSPSRAIASAIKHSNLLILIKWKRLWETNFISVIYSGNTLINPSFYVLFFIKMTVTGVHWYQFWPFHNAKWRLCTISKWFWPVNQNHTYIHCLNHW